MGSDSVQVRVTDVLDVEVAPVNTGAAPCAAAFCGTALRTHREMVNNATACWKVLGGFAEKVDITCVPKSIF